MTRAEVIAYAIFCAIVCWVLVRMNQRTVEYGRRLVHARELARASLDHWDDEDDDDPEIHRMLINLKDDSIVAHTGSEANGRELLRVIQNMKPNTTVFEHLPDAEGMSHIVAIFRTDSKTHACVAYVNT